jgi:hypothetical protein
LIVKNARTKATHPKQGTMALGRVCPEVVVKKIIRKCQKHSETQTFPTSSGEKKEGNSWQPQSFVGKNGRTDAIWQLRLHQSPLLPLAPLHLRKGHFLGEKRGHDTMKNGHKPSVFWKQPTSLGLNFFLKKHLFDHFFDPYPGNYIQPGWRFQRSRKILSIPKDFH